MRKLLIALFMLGFLGASAQAQTPFYQGKTTPASWLGTKAATSRISIRAYWLSSCLSISLGVPISSFKTSPEPPSLIAANQVYNIAKPDGLTMGAIYPALYFEQLIKKPEVKFDWTN